VPLARAAFATTALAAAALMALAALCGGCSARSAASGRVAILPLETLGTPPPDGPGLRREISGAFARSLPGAALDELSVDAALAAVAPASQPCAADAGCPRRLGRRLGAHHVLGVSVASLARTHVVRAQLWPSDGALAERELGETVVGGGAELAEAMRGLPLRLFPPRPGRWYARAWVWIGTAVVSGAVVTAAVLLTTGHGGTQPDLTAPLP
jgi:hypothetical protein